MKIHLILIFLFLAINSHATELKLNGVPAVVLSKCLDEYGKIANIDEVWDDSCISVKDGPPRSKFVLACNEGDLFSLICLKGGYLVNTILYSFKKSGTKWNLIKERSTLSISEKLDCTNFKKFFPKDK